AEVARGSDDAIGQRVATQDSAEYVDEDRLDVRIREQNSECVLDLLCICAAADVEEVRRAASRVLDDVHGRHGQAGSVDHASHGALELDVIQAELRCFHLERIFFVEIAQLEQVLVPELRVVVEVDLGVERVNLVVFGQNERID